MSESEPLEITWDEAKREANRAKHGMDIAKVHLDALADDGETAPAASTFEAIIADPENRGAPAVLVEASEPARAG